MRLCFENIVSRLHTPNNAGARFFSKEGSLNSAHTSSSPSPYNPMIAEVFVGSKTENTTMCFQ